MDKYILVNSTTGMYLEDFSRDGETVTTNLVHAALSFDNRNQAKQIQAYFAQRGNTQFHVIQLD